ncbi:permease prefix domain 2-containing transporter [Spirosoma telluris]|uniref:permease prefix domain 2-containing transporter n=1 Tax=Spirosoma telluris TaxID=2183553 RepID=UPI002FC35BFE
MRPHRIEEVQGDLHEEFEYQVRRIGERRARWRYWWDVLGFMKPFAVKRKPTIAYSFPGYSGHYQNPSIPDMLRTYFKIAFRNLTQSKGYSALTIFGLALGLSVSLLSILYVADELSYDRYNEKADRIYRINSDISFSLRAIKAASSPTPMGQTLKKDFPEVEEATRLGKYGSHMITSHVVKSNHIIIREKGVLYADSTVFNVFTLPMLAGNPKKALTEPQSVVITESTAKKYFGTTNALNRVLVFDDNDVRKVTGVIEDIPAQSHFQADFLLPLHELNDAKVNKWGNHMFTTYVLLRPGTDPKSVEAKFEHILQTYVDPALRRYFNTSLAESRKAGNDFKYSLMP